MFFVFDALGNTELRFLILFFKTILLFERFAKPSVHWIRRPS